MPVAQSANADTFSLLKLIDGINPAATPEQQAAAVSELFEVQAAQKRGGVEIASRPGLPLPLTRDMTVGSATGGGNLVGSTVAEVAAAARPATVFSQLGAIRIDAPGGSDLLLPRWTGDLSQTAAWIGELSPAPDFSELATLSIQSSPKCCAARTGFSRRLEKQSSTPIEQALLAEMARAIRAVLDHAFLNGDGSENRPLGVLNVPDLGSVESFAAATPTITELSGMVAAALTADADLAACRWLLSNADFAALLRTEAVSNTGEPVIEYSDGSYRILGFPVAASAHLPQGKFLFGAFNQCREVFFGAPQIVVNRYHQFGPTGQVEATILNYVDFLVMEPSQIILGSA